LAFSQNQSGDQSSDTRINVHNRSTRKIQRASGSKKSTDSPYPMANGIVDQYGPEEREDTKG
jgi:hypothetical protein